MPDIEKRLVQHPDIVKRLAKYNRCRMLVDDDEDTILSDEKHDFVFKLPHESASQYAERKQIFVNGIINPSIELITAPGNTIYRSTPTEDIEPGHELLSEFATNAVLGESNPTSLMQWMQEQACPQFRQYGTVWAVLDQPAVQATSLLDRIDRRVYPYVCKLLPWQVLYWQFGRDGDLLWFAYKVVVEPEWLDPSQDKPKTDIQVRILDRQSMTIHHGDNSVEVLPHGFGFVPVVWQSSFIQDPAQMVGDCSFFVTSKLIISAANYLTCGNMELLKLSTPTLLMHQAALGQHNIDTDTKGNVRVKKVDENGLLIWDGDVAPAYLARELELVEVSRQRYQLYMDEAIENEKNAKSVRRKGVDGSDVQQSGIETAFERDPIEANIASTAGDCQALHTKILTMAHMIIEGVSKAPKPDDLPFTVQYEKHYDIKSFENRLEAVKVMTNDISGYPSETGKREIYKSLTPGITEDPDIAKTINEEIDNADLSENVIPSDRLDSIMNGVPMNKKDDDANTPTKETE